MLLEQRGAAHSWQLHASPGQPFSLSSLPSGPSCLPRTLTRALLSPSPCPLQVSALTNLRVLYLHNAFHRTARLAPADWDALRPLCRLAFLSISGNRLHQLPPAVACMRRLQVRGCGCGCGCAWGQLRAGGGW